MPLTICDINVTSPNNPKRKLLQNVHMALQDGTITLVIGETGSGKSTLLQTLAGVYKPSSGTIELDGEPLWHGERVTRKQLLRLGLTFQFPEQQLFARNIQQEFAYSLRPYRLKPEERENRIRTVLDEFDASASAFNLQASPFVLSGGQRRLMALATTIATLPDWLLMDEPTAGLEAKAAANLINLILKHKSRHAGGIVIATHDLDSFWPIADRIIVLHHGEIAADETPFTIDRHPELLLRAGVGLPSSIKLQQILAQRGIEIALDGLTLQDMTDAVAGVIAAKQEKRIRRKDVQLETRHEELADTQPYPSRLENEPAMDLNSHDSESATAPELDINYETADVTTSNWFLFDPRSKWLLYLMFGAATLLQTHVIGLIAALGMIAAGFYGLPYTIKINAIKIVKPFTILSILAITLSGLEFSYASGSLAFGFALDNAMVTGINLLRLFILTLASYWLTATTPYASMLGGLNWALAFGKRIKLPLESFAMAASLIFHFIPMILREWQRFAIIVRARGKAATRRGRIRARDIPALVVPLLLALFQSAEDMIIAMEMKGMGSKQSSLTASNLTWHRRDSNVVMGGAFVFLIMITLFLIK